MAIYLLPEQSITVEHSVGGLEEECGVEYIRMVLPILYNIVYGDIMRDPMYNNLSGNIHGSVILQILRNSPVMLIDLLSTTDWEDAVLEIEGVSHNHGEEDDNVECFACSIVRDKYDLILEMAEAMVQTMPYVPMIRQHMAIEGNSLSVIYLDPYNVIVKAHGIESCVPLDKDVEYSPAVINGLMEKDNGFS